jgi:hypothetical protein
VFDLPRNIWVLFCAQAFGSCGTITVITIGGIVGAVMAPEESLATAPVTAMILGVAITTIPAAMVMQRVGRRAGSIMGTFTAMAGAGLGAYAIAMDNFWLFVIAMIPIGSNQAFIQQYRFAAIESVDSAAAPRAVSTIMLGAIVAAFVGPEVGIRAAHALPESVYAGSFIGLGALYLCSAIILTQLRVQATPVVGSSAQGGARPLTNVLFQSITITALLGAAIGYGVMTLLMTATPISMHVHNGFSLGETKGVIQAHVMAMFLPSLFTGRLVARFGEKPMLLAGIILNILAVIAAVHGQTLVHFTIALVLLGVGWNLLYLASTTLLSKSYRGAERYRIQAANDFAVFGFQAFASLSAGFLIVLVGWEHLALSATLPLSAFLLLLTVYWVRSSRTSKPGSP